MRIGGLQVHLPHPHIALHMPHPMQWLHGHQMVMIWLMAGLVFLFFAAMMFFAYRLGGSSGSATLRTPYYMPY
jgi:hypothetical protein